MAGAQFAGIISDEFKLLTLGFGTDGQLGYKSLVDTEQNVYYQYEPRIVDFFVEN